MALYIRGSKRASAKSVPFLYCWTHNATGKWYVGSRTAPGCNPDDGYICSSKAVKEMIISEHDAALQAGSTAPTVRSWAKNNKNGWTFQLKEVA